MIGPLSSDIMLSMKSKYNLTAFLETGTHIGETSEVASRHFQKVFTVELSKDVFDVARLRLRGLNNVISTTGSSPEFIRKTLADNPNERFMFWLDAHWCGGPKVGHECPLMFELQEIAPTHSSHVILIDDARLFTSPPPPPHDPSEWPSFDDITTLVASWTPSPIVNLELPDVIAVEPSV